MQCLVEKEVAQEAYNKASAEERRIESEIQDVERKLAMDYGKDERFAQLVDQCFEFKEIEYVFLFGLVFAIFLAVPNGLY